MSTIGTNAEDLILNADGSGSDIKFKSNGTEVGSISDGGVMTATSFAGSGASLTSLPADATKAPLANPTFTGTVSKSGSSSGTAKIFTTASDASEIYLYMGTGATKFRKQDDSANTLEILPDGKGRSLFTAASWFTAEGSGTPSFNQSHNCSSIESMGSSGYYRVHWDTNLTTSTYAIVNTSHRDSYEDQQLYNITRTGESARYVYVQDSAGGIDIADFSSIIFGD